MIQSESVRMLSFLASSDTCMSRAKRYADGLAFTVTLGHPYNLLCFPGDARWSEVAAEFCDMMVKLESSTSLPIAKRSSTTNKAYYMLEFKKKMVCLMGRSSYSQTCLSPAHTSQSLLCLSMLLTCHDLQNRSNQIPHP